MYTTRTYPFAKVRCLQPKATNCKLDFQNLIQTMPLLELQLKHPENLIPDFLEFTRKCSFFAKFSSTIQRVTFVRSTKRPKWIPRESFLRCSQMKLKNYEKSAICRPYSSMSSERQPSRVNPLKRICSMEHVRAYPWNHFSIECSPEMFATRMPRLEFVKNGLQDSCSRSNRGTLESFGSTRFSFGRSLWLESIR